MLVELKSSKVTLTIHIPHPFITSSDLFTFPELENVSRA